MIEIFWSCLEPEWQLAQEPESVASRFYKSEISNSNNQLLNINYCPAFNNHIKNVFCIKSIYDYSFQVLKNNNVLEVRSDMYDQEFFNNHVVIRDLDKRVFSFHQRFIFFTKEPSLKVDFYLLPFLEVDNLVLDSCILLPGTFDIGKWYRNLELPFVLRQDKNIFQTKINEVLYYIRVHTDKKIKWTQYRYNERLDSFRRDGFALNQAEHRLKTLENYYVLFRNKKLILKEIKDNIL